MAVQEALDLNLTPSKRKSAAQYISESVRAVRQSRQKMDENIAAAWERFEIMAPNRDLPFENASNIRTGLTYWTVRGTWVRILRTVFGQDPVMNVKDASTIGGPDPDVTQKMLDHLVEVDLALRSTESQAILNGLVEGTAVGKLVRDTEERTVRDREGDILMQRVVTDRVGMRQDIVDLKDFIVANPAIDDINKQPWVAHRTWLRWDDILRRQRDGIYTVTRAQLAKIKPLSRTRRWTEGMRLDQAKAEADQAEDTAGYELQEYPIWEYQGKYDVDGKGFEQECLFAVHEDFLETPLRSQTSPWWNGQRNYLIYRPIPRANRFYGMSLALLMQHLQDEADTRLNQNLSASTIAILAGLTPIMNRTMKQEWENRKMRMGVPLFVDAVETFQTLANFMRYNPMMGEADLNRVFALAERTSGVTDPFLGKTSKGDTTAYEIATVTQEGNVTFAEMVEQIQGTNRELGYQTIEHAYQLAQESPTFAARLVKVCGVNPFEGVTLAELRQRFDLQPTGNTVVANREVETRKWLAIWQMLKDEPLLSLPGRQKLLSRTLKVAVPDENPEEWIGTEQEAEQKQQMQQAMSGIQAGFQIGQTLDSVGQPGGQPSPTKNGQPVGQPTGQAGRIPGL